METGKRSGNNSANRTYECEIPIKYITLNEYVNKCRRNKYEAADYKKKIEYQTRMFITSLPTFKKRVSIDFLWVEVNKRRDPDNIAFAKKFILDSLVESGKLKNDTQQYIKGFSDRFEQGDENKVILRITEEK